MSNYTKLVKRSDLRSLIYRTGNQFRCGSTRSGKSVAEWNDIVAAAEKGDVAICVFDPHKQSLAYNVFQQLVARGHEGRIIYDQLHHHLHVPGYRFLKQSTKRNHNERLAENEETAKGFTDILCRRGGVNIAAQPQKEEWILKAIRFLLNQPKERPASDLRYVFKTKHHTFKSLLRGCTDRDTRDEFTEIAAGTIRAGMYHSAARLIEGTCGALTFIERCGTTFDLEKHLDKAGILIVEGGVEADIMGTIMGALQMQIINYVRRRGTDTPRVLIVLDECNNASLVSEHETRAMAECQKMGLDFHVLCQLLDFPSAAVTNGVLANCVRHEWFWNANTSVINKAVEDLNLRSLVGTGEDPGKLIRELTTGSCYVKQKSIGENIDRKDVHMLENPWGFPKLAAVKTHKALSRVRKRREYQQPADEASEVTADLNEFDHDNDEKVSPTEPLTAMELLRREQREGPDA